jgi:hypothetical protein
VRIWSFHPKYLDRQGLIALWREALLAQKVLRGETRGYKHHPQLLRFRSQYDPVAAIAKYLEYVFAEAVTRGYNFDRHKIEGRRINVQIPVSRDQLLYEWEHLKGKLLSRDPERFREYQQVNEPEPHPLFKIAEGEVEDWERRK